MSSQYINQEIGIQVAFILEFKLQKSIFQPTGPSLAANVSCFKSLSGWEPAQICRNLRTEKEGICGKVFKMKVTCVTTG